MKSNYWKQSATNFYERTRKNYMATAVLIEYNDQDPSNPLTTNPL